MGPAPPKARALWIGSFPFGTVVHRSRQYPTKARFTPPTTHVPRDPGRQNVAVRFVTACQGRPSCRASALPIDEHRRGSASTVAQCPVGGEFRSRSDKADEGCRPSEGGRRTGGPSSPTSWFGSQWFGYLSLTSVLVFAPPPRPWQATPGPSGRRTVAVRRSRVHQEARRSRGCVSSGSWTDECRQPSKLEETGRGVASATCVVADRGSENRGHESIDSVGYSAACAVSFVSLLRNGRDTEERSGALNDRVISGAGIDAGTNAELVSP